MNLGEKIRMHRKELNMAKDELALKVRVGTGFLDKIESNKITPDLQTLLKISTALDVPASEFLENIECNQLVTNLENHLTNNK
ncbi:helix-turn-helix domain-containing protein [Pseudalkalibacillus caeni]|nr:helix-turn-helix transcriptional regulator [Pseudalkalibacillus caeni]